MNIDIEMLIIITILISVNFFFFILSDTKFFDHKNIQDLPNCITVKTPVNVN